MKIKGIIEKIESYAAYIMAGDYEVSIEQARALKNGEVIDIDAPLAERLIRTGMATSIQAPDAELGEGKE